MCVVCADKGGAVPLRGGGVPVQGLPREQRPPLFRPRQLLQWQVLLLCRYSRLCVPGQPLQHHSRLQGRTALQRQWGVYVWHGAATAAAAVQQTARGVPSPSKQERANCLCPRIA